MRTVAGVSDVQRALAGVAICKIRAGRWCFTIVRGVAVRGFLL
ncbi:hypothetical protein [Fibrobacter sp. UWH9]|nr:hypothetical protein [Fibrobacter sp. UWH9]